MLNSQPQAPFSPLLGIQTWTPLMLTGAVWCFPIFQNQKRNSEVQNQKMFKTLLSLDLNNSARESVMKL